MGLGFRGWEVEYDDDGGDCGLDDTLGPAISDCGGWEGHPDMTFTQKKGSRN